MKKLLNKLSSSGRIENLEDTHSDEEHLGLDPHYRKPTSLPVDTKDSSQDIKIKKSFSGSGSIGKAESRDSAFSKHKSSNGVKHHKDKDLKDTEKLHESDDKSLKKSGSRKHSLRKSNEVKNSDSMKSPALKGVFVSSYEHQKDGEVESSDSEDESVPRSRGNSMHDDEEFSFAPIRVPSAPARMASSPVPSTPTKRSGTPRMDGASSPMAYSPPASPFHAVASSPSHMASSPVPNLPRSVSSPNPAAANARPVLAADDFDLRFGVINRERTESISDETSLGADFEKTHRKEQVRDDVDMIEDDGEMTNQKGRSGLFSFGKNTPKKLK